MGRSRITLFFPFYVVVCNILYLSLFWLSHDVWFVLKQSKYPQTVLIYVWWNISDGCLQSLRRSGLSLWIQTSQTWVYGLCAGATWSDWEVELILLRSLGRPAGNNVAPARLLLPCRWQAAPRVPSRHFVPYPDRVCLALFPWGLLEGKGVWSLRADALQLVVALRMVVEAVVLRWRRSIPLPMPLVLRSPWCWLGPTCGALCSGSLLANRRTGMPDVFLQWLIF